VPDVKRALRNLSFSNIGLVYVWVLVIVIFSITTPSLFPTSETIRAVLNNYSLAGLAALAVLVPLVSGAIDASIGGNISLTSVVCARLIGDPHVSIVEAVVLTLLVGALIGLANVLVVVVLQIPAIIGTLAIWLIADALSVAVSGNLTLASARLSGSFSSVFSGASWGEVTIPVLFVLVIGVILGVLLTQTSSGRYTYAAGLNPEVARDAGIPLKFVQARALVVGGMLGAFTGIVLVAHIASASPLGGDNYLLPAFAAVFLGATQFRSKRFNAMGTILAVFMLGTGQYGLVLAGAPQWTPNIFQGLALITAMGFSHFRGPMRFGKGARRWPLPFRRRSPEALPRDGGSPSPVAVP
jgi:ribose transport system permease protein